VVKTCKKMMVDNKSREKNIIITGIDDILDKSNRSDQEIAEFIVEKVKVDKTKIKFCQRLKKDNKNINAIKVVLDSISDKKTVFQNISQLKNICVPNKNIYINDDLSFEDRQIRRSLRQERDEKNSILTKTNLNGKYETDNDGDYYYGINYYLNKVVRRKLSIKL
jgi:hypothetical protein